jgi:hypothetical protein
MFGYDGSLHGHTYAFSGKDGKRNTKEKQEMISPEKMKELRKRMRDHTSVKDIAVVVLTARELQELLDIVEEKQETMTKKELTELHSRKCTIQHDDIVDREGYLEVRYVVSFSLTAGEILSLYSRLQTGQDNAVISDLYTFLSNAATREGIALK